MDRKQFKEFCKNEFTERGFKKQRNMFYLTGYDLLCGIDLQNPIMAMPTTLIITIL